MKGDYKHVKTFGRSCRRRTGCAGRKNGKRIYLPDTAHKDKPQTGKVVAVGTGRLLDNGTRIASEVKVGETVVFAKYSGSEVELDGKDYIILRDSDILAVVEDK